MREKIIVFPVPDLSIVFHDQSIVPQKDIFAVTYQYDFNNQGYGPYGFFSDKSKQLLTALFENGVIWVKGQKNLIDWEYSSPFVIIFSSELTNIQFLKEEYQKVKDYLLDKKKVKKFEQRNSLGLFELFHVQSGKLDFSVLKKYLRENMLVTYYTSIYGLPSYVFFEKKNDLIRVETVCTSLSLDIELAVTFDAIKPW